MNNKPIQLLRRIFLCIFTMSFIFMGNVMAQEAPNSATIDSLNKELASDPRCISCLLKRGSEYMVIGSFDQAVSDLRR